MPLIREGGLGVARVDRSRDFQRLGADL